MYKIDRRGEARGGSKNRILGQTPDFLGSIYLQPTFLRYFQQYYVQVLYTTNQQTSVFRDIWIIWKRNTKSSKKRLNS